MASIEKRPTGYRVRITRRGFSRESATFPTMGQARAWATRREAELLATKHGQIIQRTVKQALEKYRDEVAPGHRGARWECIRCDKLIRTLPFVNRPLEQVRCRDIASWRDAALVGGPDIRPLAPASVRREMGLLRLAFERCRLEWGWLASNPMEGVRRPANPPARNRVATDDEIEAIVNASGYKRATVPYGPRQQAAFAALFALETAMRAGEICSLTRETIHERHVTLSTTKNGDARAVPLSKAAQAMVRIARNGFGLTPQLLDVYFRTIRDAAGVKGLHFHDLRATAITRLARKLDVLELARMIGHRDIRSLLTYYRATPQQIADRLG